MPGSGDDDDEDEMTRQPAKTTMITMKTKIS